ncbi:MAG: restriction endonuclease, partial [Isosphaeraceae bacterium]
EELRISNKKINIAKTSIKEVDEMDGLEFELFIADIFKLKGYTIETTPVSGDFGVDLILNKNSIKSALQAKRYTGNVGVSAIQEVISGCAYYKCDNSIVLTNSFFTAAAVELGSKLGVFLINRTKLIKMITSLNDNM